MSIPPLGGAGQPPFLPGGPPCSKHLEVLSQTHRLSCWSLTPHSGGTANLFFTEQAEARIVKLGTDHTLGTEGLGTLWDHDVATFATPQPLYSEWASACLSLATVSVIFCLPAFFTPAVWHLPSP